MILNIKIITVKEEKSGEGVPCNLFLMRRKSVRMAKHRSFKLEKFGYRG